MNFRVQPGKKIHRHPDLAMVEISLDIANDENRGTLNVKVRFNESEAVPLFGMIRFQLRKAAVRLDFTGCKSGLVNKCLETNISLSSDQQHEFEVSTSLHGLTDSEAGGSIELSDQGRSKITGSTKNRNSSDRTDTIRRKLNVGATIAHVVVSGSSDSLRFSFESAHPLISLRGHVSPEDWCGVSLGPRSGRISASLTVAPKDIRILGVGGIWPEDISSNKRLLIQLYALRFLDLGVSPFIVAACTQPSAHS